MDVVFSKKCVLKPNTCAFFRIEYHRGNQRAVAGVEAKSAPARSLDRGFCCFAVGGGCSRVLETDRDAARRDILRPRVHGGSQDSGPERVVIVVRSAKAAPHGHVACGVGSPAPEWWAESLAVTS